MIMKKLNLEAYLKRVPHWFQMVWWIYDEVLTPFGGINRNFYIPDDILYKISTSNPKRKHQIEK